MAPHSCWLHKSIIYIYLKFTPAVILVITSLLHLNCADGLLTKNNSSQQCRCYNLDGASHSFIFLCNQVRSVLPFEETSIVCLSVFAQLGLLMSNAFSSLNLPCLHFCRLLKNLNLNRICKIKKIIWECSSGTLFPRWIKIIESKWKKVIGSGLM